MMDSVVIDHLFIKSLHLTDVSGNWNIMNQYTLDSSSLLGNVEAYL